MSAGMAEVIAAHDFLPMSMSCRCSKWSWSDGEGGADYPHATHVAEELTKAGYGNVRKAAIETLREEAGVFTDGEWCEPYIRSDVRDDRDAAKATAQWLNQRADAMEAPHGVG